MVGQYAHGNEPSHYLYAYIGAHHKTQARVRSLMAADGLAGNEECGQMSALSLYAVDRRHAGVLHGALPNRRFGIDPADRPPAFGQSAVAGHSMEGMSVVPARSHPINGNAVTNAMALRQSAGSFGRAGL